MALENHKLKQLYMFSLIELTKAERSLQDRKKKK
jgi:hypothetical protein